MADPIDLGLFNPVIIPLKMAQPFPEISAPFTHHKRDAEGRLISDGVINQIWLQLLIQLWNRTGGAGGAETIDAILLAISADNADSAEANQNSLLATLISTAVQTEVARLGLDQTIATRVAELTLGLDAVRSRDPLEALLFMDSSGSGSSSPDTDDTSWVPSVDGSEPPVFITDGAGNLIFVAYSA